MSSIFPISQQLPALSTTAGLSNVYNPNSCFQFVNGSYTALPDLCPSSLSNQQMNGIVSELISFAECLNPCGTWDLNSSQNLCSNFSWWINNSLRPAAAPNIVIASVPPASLSAYPLVWKDTNTGKVYYYKNPTDFVLIEDPQSVDINVQGLVYTPATTTLTLTETDGTVHNVNLASLVDVDTKVSAAAFNSGTNILTITLSDGSTFPVDLTSLANVAAPADVNVQSLAYAPATTTLTLTETDGTVHNVDLSSLVNVDTKVSAAAFNSGTNILMITLTDGSTFPVDLSALANVAAPADVNVQSLAYVPATGVLTITETDGSTYAVAVKIVSADAGNMIVSGSDGGAKLTPAKAVADICADAAAKSALVDCVLSNDPGNKLVLGSDGAIYYNDASADLAVTKAVAPTAASTGDPVVYTIVVTNNGPSAANGATIVDSLPANFTVSSVAWSYSSGAAGGSGTAPNFTVATLPNGGIATLTITGAFSAAGTYSNSVTVAPPSGVADTVTANNSATAPTVTVTLSCAAMLAAVNPSGTARTQYFATAGSLHSSTGGLNEVQAAAGWDMPNSTYGTTGHLTLTMNEWGRFLSGTTTFGRPTLRPAIIAYAGGIGSGLAKIVTTTDTAVNTLVENSLTGNAEIWITSGSLYVPCNTIAGSIRFRMNVPSPAAAESFIYLWDGAGVGPVNTATTSAYYLYAGSAPITQQVTSPITLVPGKRIGFVYAGLDSLGLNNTHLEISINGGAFQNFETAAEISAAGLLLDLN